MKTIGTGIEINFTKEGTMIAYQLFYDGKPQGEKVIVTRRRALTVAEALVKNFDRDNF